MANIRVVLWTVLLALFLLVIGFSYHRGVRDYLLESPSLVEEGDGFNKHSAEVSQMVAKREASVTNSAVLVAGTSGYYNYRHQADMCHAFQLLRKGGIPIDNIITFVYDDIAYNSANPYRGSIFNAPGGYDVYPNCAKDYTGLDVNKEVVVAVLTGDHKHVKHIGSGRVLPHNPKQRVFFAYSGRGSAGSVTFPRSDSFFADELNNAVEKMEKNKMFHEMLLYIDTCNAGAMFQGLYISKRKKVLGVSACDAHECSWATYCPDESDRKAKDEVTPAKVGACLGDLFSVAWIEDAENADMAERTMKEHIDAAAERTSGKSTVTKYGDKKHNIIKETIGAFFSGAPLDSIRATAKPKSSEKHSVSHKQHSQEDAKLAYLYHQAQSGKNAQAHVNLEQEIEMRVQTDIAIIATLEKLVDVGDLPLSTSVSSFANDLIPHGGPDAPIVSDWQCLKEMTKVWEDHCSELNEYSIKYSKTFANLCNAKVSFSSFKNALTC